MSPRISNPSHEPSSLPRVNLLLWPMGMKGNHFLALSSNQLALILKSRKSPYFFCKPMGVGGD